MQGWFVKKFPKREERPSTELGREWIPGEWDEWDGEHSRDPLEIGKYGKGPMLIS